jgi:hypothetical protein
MKKENTPIVVTSIIAGSVILVAVIALLVFMPITTTSQNVVTVQGTSSLKVLPDLVSVSFNIQNQGSTPSVASDANSKIYNDLKEALIALGFNESQIGTQYFSINPNYEYNNGKQTQNGYTATHSVKIEFSANNTELLGKAVDAGISAGAGVSSLDFELSPSLQSQYKNQALELASKDAESKADAVAKGFDKSLGKLVSVNVDSYNYMPWVMYSASSDSVASGVSARAAAEKLTPTQQDVTATVSATYKLS